MPLVPSGYVEAAIEPMRAFLQQHADHPHISLWATRVVDDATTRHGWNCYVPVLIQRSFAAIVCDVVTQVRKIEESLLKLKRSRKTDDAAAATTVSDEDKIRHQLYLDVRHWGAEVRVAAICMHFDTVQCTSALGVDTAGLLSYQALLKLVEDAKTQASAVPDDLNESVVAE